MDDSDPSYVHYRLKTAVDRVEHRLLGCTAGAGQDLISRSCPPAACVDHSPVRPFLEPGHLQVAPCRVLPGAMRIVAGAAAAVAGRVTVVAVADAAV